MTYPIDGNSSRVCIACPADPAGVVAGGIDTFIRGVIRYAPSDIEFAVVGASTDPEQRPIGQWTRCSLGRRSFDFLPIIDLDNQKRAPWVPVSLRYTWALILNLQKTKSDIVELHEIEPGIGLIFDKRPRNVIIHTNMNAIRDQESSIRWRHFPWMYFMLERFLMRRSSSVFCVRSDAVEDYKRRYPHLAGRFRFTPTWVDSDIFSPAPDDERARDRISLRKRFGFPADSPVLISVGRLSREKNPELLFHAFTKVREKYDDARLIFVGDGNLGGRLKTLIRQHDMDSDIVLAGIRSSVEVAEFLRGADIFVLSSVFEGMPMSVLEALGCGLPVVTTDVGEVGRVVFPGRNGEVVSVSDQDHLADGITNCLLNVSKYRGKPCTSAVQDFMPGKVLEPIYDNYRRLARSITNSTVGG